MYKYNGPNYEKGQRINVFGRTIDPASWTQEECEQWFSIDERLKSLFTTVPINGKAKEAAPDQVK